MWWEGSSFIEEGLATEFRISSEIMFSVSKRKTIKNMKKTTYCISMKETTSSISTKEISILRSKLIINMKTSRFKKVLHPASAGKSRSL